ncbi:MAG: tetratricopeptide repeat protein [Planctomycetota bacterium]
MSSPTDTQSPSPTPWCGGLAIVALALGLRVWHLVELRDDPFFQEPILDARYYLDFADRIIQGHVSGAEVYRGPPLQGYFVAALRFTFGGSPWVVPLAQALLSALTAGLAVRIGTRLAGRKAGMIAGLLVATCWTLVLYAAVVVPATLALFLATLALASSLDVEVRNPRWRPLLATGVLVALGGLARERTFLFGLLLAGWWLWHGRKRLRIVVGMGAPLLLALALTTLNNTLASGDFLLYTANGGVNFYIGNGPDANGRFHPPSGFSQSREGMYDDARELACEEERRILTPSEVESYWYRRTFRHVATHPLEALRSLALKVSHFTGARESWDVIYGDGVRESSFLLSLPLPGYALIGILGWAGLTLARRRPRFDRVAILLLSQLLFVLVFFAGSRFRLGAIPPLAITAGLLLSEAWERRHDARRPVRLLALVAFSVLFVLAPFPGREKDASAGTTWHANLALAALLRGDPAAAGQHAREALRLDPDNVSARVYMGRLLLDAGALEEAEPHLRRAIELAPRDTRALLTLGVLLVDRGARDAADELFRRVLEHDPENAKAHFERARYLLERGDREGALRHASHLQGNARYRERLQALGLD